MQQPQAITLAELDAIIDAPAPRPRIDPACTLMLAQLATECRMPAMDDLQLLDIAAETDQRGPQATIDGIFDALRNLHSDAATQALIAALQHYHLPALVDVARSK